MKESATLEFKEAPSKTFLKTVSAFANFGTGRILFGVNDEGKAVGLPDPDEARLAIENAINDSLDPRPTYYLETKREGTADVVSLTVYEGSDKPYLCSGKAYRRADTATVPVDRSELRRLSIEGSDCPYDEMDASNQNLTFEVLGKSLRQALGIDVVAEDTLKTLGLLKEGSFNNAAALLADTNEFPGIDIVRYALDESSIHERITCEGVSVLAQIDRAVTEYRRHYVVERVEGMTREKHEVIPKEAFREAVANALVRRLWYVKARVVVSLYPKRVEIVSPGGLPFGTDEDLYLEGGVSIPRNATLAYVFLRLGVIERLGTGIRRIQRSYEESVVKPSFSLSPHVIKVTLPALDGATSLSLDERNVLEHFEPGLELASAELQAKMELSRSTVVRAISSLVDKGTLVRVGKGRATRYRLA